MRDRVFCDLKMRGFGDKFVAVRILGGLDATEEGRLLHLRLSNQGFSQIYALAPDGAYLTHRDAPNSADELLSFMRLANKLWTQYAKDERSISPNPTNIAGERKLYGHLWKHKKYEDLMRQLEKTPQHERRSEVADISYHTASALLHKVFGKASKQRGALSGIVKRHSMHPECIGWKIDMKVADIVAEARYFTYSVPGLIWESQQIVKRLLALLAQTSNPAHQAVIRARIISELETIRTRGSFEQSKPAQRQIDEHRTWIARQPVFDPSEPLAVLAQCDIVLRDPHKYRSLVAKLRDRVSGIRKRNDLMYNTIYRADQAHMQLTSLKVDK